MTEHELKGLLKMWKDGTKFCRKQPFIDPGPSRTEIFLHQMVLLNMRGTVETHLLCSIAAITGNPNLPWREGK